MATDAWQKYAMRKRGGSSPNMPSQSWYCAFLDRKPTLKTIMAKVIETPRHNNATDGQLTDWFRRVYLPLCDANDYDSHMIANCDETMLQVQSGNRIKIIAPRENGYKFITAEETLGHITLVVTIFANGWHAPSLIIFPQKTLPKETNFKDLADDSEYVVTGKEGGWIDRIVFEQYCLQVVIPAFEQQRLKVRSDNKRGLFVLDGHSSRWNGDLMKTFAEHHIDVVTLVSHTSHVSQPLDVIVFSVFKRNLRQNLRKSIAAMKREKIELSRFADEETVLVRALDGMDLEGDEVVQPVAGEEMDVDPPTNAQDPQQEVSTLSVPERRYCLIECAKLSLHIALYRDTVRSSFKTAGIYPWSLETALKQKSIRTVPDLEGYIENLAVNRGRTRTSISGSLLTSEKAIQMLNEEENRKKAVAPRKTTKAALKPKKTK